MPSFPKHRDYLEFLTNCFRFCLLAVLCKDAFLPPVLHWHSACRAKGDKKKRKFKILRTYFNVLLMCERMQIKKCLLFPLEFIECWSQTKWQWSRKEMICYRIQCIMSIITQSLYNPLWFTVKGSKKATLMDANFMNSCPFSALKQNPLVYSFGQLWWLLSTWISKIWLSWGGALSRLWFCDAGMSE